MRLYAWHHEDGRKVLDLDDARPISELPEHDTSMMHSAYHCECGERCVESSRYVACPQCKVYWRIA